MINNCRKLKGPGIDLVSSIYDFWMKSFKDFVDDITGVLSSKASQDFH